MSILTVTCPACVVCGSRAQLEVDFDGFAAWQDGTYLQNALPELDADQRELLMTGTHAHCWEIMFGGDDE